MNEKKWEKINKKVEDQRFVHKSDIPNKIREEIIVIQEYNDNKLNSLHEKMNDFALWSYEVCNKLRYNFDELFAYAEEFKIWFNTIYSEEDVNNFNFKNEEDFKECMRLFLASLDDEEEKIFTKPELQNTFLLHETDGYFQLSQDYKIIDAFVKLDLEEKGPYVVTHELIYLTNEFVGLNIPQAIKLLNAYHLNNDANDLKRVFDKFILKKEFFQRFLYYTLYSILESGDNWIAPKRALMFAKDFNLDIDIPIIYGINKNDPEYITLVNKYLELGGNENIICIVDYYRNLSQYIYEDEIKNTLKLKDLIKR